jgi:hypothetical protein
VDPWPPGRHPPPTLSGPPAPVCSSTRRYATSRPHSPTNDLGRPS